MKLLTETLKEFNVEAMDQVAAKNPAPYDSKGNGSIENGIRQVQGLLRTMQSCLEQRLQSRIPSSHAAVWWLVEHVAWILNVRTRGADGRTACERLRGRAFNKKFLGFGEQCLAKTHAPRMPGEYDAHGKLAERWCKGTFLGYNRNTNEYVVSSGASIVRTRAI